MPRSKSEYRFAHERLRDARENLGLTPARIAKSVNVETEVYLSWEDGREEPLGSQLARISHVLHKPMSRFIEEV